MERKYSQAKKLYPYDFSLGSQNRGDKGGNFSV